MGGHIQSPTIRCPQSGRCRPADRQSRPVSWYERSKYWPCVIYINDKFTDLSGIRGYKAPTSFTTQSSSMQCNVSNMLTCSHTSPNRKIKILLRQCHSKEQIWFRSLNADIFARRVGNNTAITTTGSSHTWQESFPPKRDPAHSMLVVIIPQ